jgi:putative tryptophan/tyrosine transport system substrate-binding protein
MHDFGYRGTRMQRREFITCLGGAAVTTWANAALAQPAPPLIAILGSGAADAPSSIVLMREIGDGMRALGLIAGRDYVFEGWWADSDSSRFPALADALLVRRPAAVLVATVFAVQVLQERSRTVPIVMTGMNDPVAAGLITSLARPGGNVTGVSNMAGDVQLKLVEMARDAMPELRSIAVMMNPTNPTHRPWLELLQSQATALKLLLATVSVAAPADLDGAFAEIVRARPDALLVLTDNSLLGLSNTIVARALSQRIPTFGGFTGTFSEAGALFNYGRDQKEAYQAVARYLKNILAGAKPADLPVEQPTRFTLSINLKTARTLGITIPPILLFRADEVIE